MTVPTERLRDPHRRAERAAKILDVTADLLSRHGSRRVTVDDVAAGAGIGKGTVYLHWKTREQLFGAVFAREVLHAIGELRQAVRRDPQVCLLHRFARTYFLAIVNRPLLHRLLLGDPDLLGGRNGPSRDDRHGATLDGYLGALARYGLLRDDLGLDEVGYAYQATFEGFLRAEGTSPVTDSGRRADLLAETVRRAFESGSPAPEAVVGELAEVTATLLGDLIDADRAVFGIPVP